MMGGAESMRAELMRADMPATRRGGLIVAVLAGAGIVVSLMQTLLVPILPELPSLLHTSEANASWAVTATLLSAAVATPVFGRLGDMYGKRRILLASTAFMVAGSLVCALSSSLLPMIAGRALQGLSAAVIPVGISVMRDQLPVQKLSSSVALMSASLGVGGALGLPAAALIAEHANWHMLFWVSVVLGVVAAVLVRVVILLATGIEAAFCFDCLDGLRRRFVAVHDLHEAAEIVVHRHQISVD